MSKAEVLYAVSVIVLSVTIGKMVNSAIGFLVLGGLIMLAAFFAAVARK